MRAALTLLPMLGSLTVCAQSTNMKDYGRSVGLGTTTPQFYYYGGDNMGLEIYNSNTVANSQAHLILSTGATSNYGSAGTLSWMTPNSTGNKGVAYISARTIQDATTNASGKLYFATAENAIPSIKMQITSKGYVGIGIDEPRAFLDVARAGDNVTSTVFGRLAAGNGESGGMGTGTYLGVQNYSADGLFTKSFAIEHRFYSVLNSAINFYRGNSTLGGFITFSTYNGTEQMRIDPGGNVGIGTTATGNYKLTVEGAIGARRVRVTQDAWADFVFNPEYKLPSLKELDKYVRENKHLPGVPSETEVKEKGIDVGEMNKILLQKVEELTLHLIEQQKQIEKMAAEIECLKHK